MMESDDNSWQAYEEQVRQLLLGKLIEWFPEVPDAALEVAGKRTFEGAKGTYEVDASARIRFDEMSLLFLVECKHWSRAVPQDVILSMKSKIEDLGAHKGIIVSDGGFQSGAIKLARANGIALWHYEPRSSPQELDVICYKFGPGMVVSLMVRGCIAWIRGAEPAFRRRCVRWIRFVDYDTRFWHFRDNNLALPSHPSSLPMALKQVANSLWPWWMLRLIKGRGLSRAEARKP